MRRRFGSCHAQTRLNRNQYDPADQIATAWKTSQATTLKRS